MKESKLKEKLDDFGTTDVGFFGFMLGYGLLGLVSVILNVVFAPVRVLYRAVTRSGGTF